MKSNRALIAILMVLVAFFAFQIVGCGSMEEDGGGDTTDGTDGTTTTNGGTPGIADSVSVSTGSTSIVADGSSQALITATVTDSNGNNVADGTTVDFSTTAGDIDSITADTQTTYQTTTTNGIATALLTSPTNVGSATVTATSGGVNGNTSVTFIPGAVSNISLTATSTSLAADGSGTSTISATVTDTNSNVVADGEIISFFVTTGAGTLSPTTATTSGGIAAVTYTASDTAGTETVTAQSANGTSGTIDITLAAVVGGGAGAPASMTVSTGSASILADGLSQALISATVKDVGGNNVTDGTTVVFFTTAGDIDSITAGTQTTYSSITSNGTATTLLTSPTIVGSATVTATCSGVNGNTTVSFLPGVVNTVSLTATSTSLAADGSSTSAISATVTDVNGNVVADGETISFNVTTGTGALFPTTATTSGGIATVTYIASKTAGTETVTAQSANGTFGTIDIILTVVVGGGAGAPASMTVSTGSASIVADGSTQALISATVKDVSGNNVTDGTTVVFSTTAGDIDSILGGTQTTYSSITSNGTASALLTSLINVGYATVTATCSGVNGSVTVEFIPDVVNTISLTATRSNLTADGSSTSAIIARVTDVNNNAVTDGETISFNVTTGTGTLSAPTGTTSGGVATVTYTASNTLGIETITAESTNLISGTVNVTLIGVQIGSVTVSAGQSELIADGITNTSITATILDSAGNPIEDGTTVNFTNNTAYGTLSAASATTTSGAASVILTSPTQSGQTAFIRADAGGLSGNTIVSFIPGPVHRIYAVANPQSIPADFIICPDDSSRIVATVLDINDNPVADDTEVVFSIDKGWIWDNFPLCTAPIPVVTSKTLPTANGIAKIAIFGGGNVETGTVSICASGLCYEDALGNPGIQVSYGATIGEASGLPTSIQLSFSVPSIQVKGTGGTETATVTAKVYDETGSPIKDNFTSADGKTLGTNVFTSASANFQTKGYSAGDTITINSGTDNGTYTITNVVSETEVTLDTAMTASETGLNFTATIKNNITFTILSGPGGGENIDGDTVLPSESIKSTIDGEASVTLSSGTFPGTIIIRAVCTQGGQTATAISPEIGIEAGEPHNIIIYESSDVEDNNDGSISWTISAMVQDQYGNPVADNTAVYFGVVDNVLSSGADGSIAGSPSVFFSAATFSTDGVEQFDTLIILDGQSEGGHIIIDNPVIDGSVTLLNDLTADAGPLNFVAGNAVYGEVCGVVPTGNFEPDPTCTPDITTTAIKGVAHTKLTWPTEAIFKPFWLFAETEARTLGKSLVGSYPGVAPISIAVTIVPDTVLAGETGITVSAQLYDGATPPHYIQDATITFETRNLAISGFGAVGVATTTDDTNISGVASVNNLVTQSCLGTDTTATIIVSIGNYIETADLSIKATTLAAAFNSLDKGDSANVYFTDASTMAAGTTITNWYWDFGAGATPATFALQDPGDVSFGAADSYFVTLTVTNNFGCQDTIAKFVTVP